MKIGFLREACSLGDSLCVAAAAEQRKKEYPGDTTVVFCPEESVDLYDHLLGVDEIVSLGKLGDILPQRRDRGSGLCAPKGYTGSDEEAAPAYLKPIWNSDLGKLVDLWCPGRTHQEECSGPLVYSRPQLFAKAAGCRDLADVRPHWRFRGIVVDEGVLAQQLIEVRNMVPQNFIYVALRGTCPTRTYPAKMATELCLRLMDRLPVVYGDCVSPHFNYPSGPGFAPITVPFPLAVAVASWARLMVVVDSAFLHVSAALDQPAVAILGPTDKIVATTYPKCSVVEGSDLVCKIPCNYNPKKHWTNGCKVMGCNRMREVTPDMILAEVLSRL